MPNSRFMEVALKEAYLGLERGDGGPFGACIVRGGKVIARGHNEVVKTSDPTRHAEVCAIQRASRKIGSPHFVRCDIYSTTEPCVMCFAAINWAQIRQVYFGTSVRDVRRLGFNELVISNRRLKSLGGGHTEIVPRFMKTECEELLDFWRRLPGKKTY